MSLGTSVLGTSTITPSIIVELRDEILADLVPLNGTIKNTFDNTSKNVKPFKELNSTDNVDVEVLGVDVVILKALVHYVTERVYKKMVENVDIVAHPRIDNYGTEFDNLIAAVDIMAAAFATTGIAPVTGATLGAALITWSTALKVGQSTRDILKLIEITKGTNVE